MHAILHRIVPHLEKQLLGFTAQSEDQISGEPRVSMAAKSGSARHQRFRRHYHLRALGWLRKLAPQSDVDGSKKISAAGTGQFRVNRRSASQIASYRARTRYTLARPTPSFFAISVAPRPSLRRRRTSSALMLGLRPL